MAVNWRHWAKKSPLSLDHLLRFSVNAATRTAGALDEGPKHPAHLLTTKVNGKTQAIYVPVDMVEEVRQWCRQYRDLKADIKQVSECCEQLIRLHAKEKRTRSGKRRRSNGT